MAKMFMCDFETTTDLNDCRVWATCAVSLEDGQVAHLSNSMDSFIEWILKTGSCKLYFHNLKFDGEFIISWLLSNGYEHVSNEQKTVPEGAFQTLISDMGQFYKIKVCFLRKGKKLINCEIFDSLKKLPFSVKQIAKDFGLSMAKGEIDYGKPRELGYEITEAEREYIVTDCQIVQEALKYQLNEGMKKMTIAGDALSYYKNMVGRCFEYWFPTLPKILDDDLRKAYKGGFTYCNPRYAGKDIGEGVTLDVNSLYPSCMYYNLLPYGYPVFFEGKYKPDPMYPLYIARIRCAFRVKPDHIPMMQIKRGIFQETEYLESSEMDFDGYKELMVVDLTLTSVDLELFLAHYETFDLEYISGYKFKGQVGMFKEYIDHWMEIKATAPKNSAQRAIAKLYLNSLYGKFASSTERLQKVPYMAPDGVVRYYCNHEPLRDREGNYCFDERGRIMYQTDEKGYPVQRLPEIIDAVYTPVGAFITAWARYKTITSAQAVYDRFIYADTDSLHLIGPDLPEGLEIHPTKLGAWDHEGTFTKARFLRAKTYMETFDGKNKVTCAGMPDNVKQGVTYENFHYGATFPGKLLPKRVKGGIVLEAVDFTIKL